MKEKGSLPVWRNWTSSTTTQFAVNCSDEEFRSIGASLYQVLQWTTANETVRIVQQPKGQKGFEAWHAIMRSSDQREHVRLEFSIRSADQ